MLPELPLKPPEKSMLLRLRDRLAPADNTKVPPSGAESEAAAPDEVGAITDDDKKMLDLLSGKNQTK